MCSYLSRQPYVHGDSISKCTLSIQLYVNHVPLRTRWSPILFTARQQLIVGTWHSSPHQLRDQHLSSQIPKPPWSKQPNASDCGFRLSRFLETSPFIFIKVCAFFPVNWPEELCLFLYRISFGDIAVWLVTLSRFGAHQFSEQQIDFDFWPSSIVGDMQDNVTQSKIAAQCFWEQQVASVYDTWWGFQD